MRRTSMNENCPKKQSVQGIVIAALATFSVVLLFTVLFCTSHRPAPVQTSFVPTPAKIIIDAKADRLVSELSQKNDIREARTYRLASTELTNELMRLKHETLPDHKGTVYALLHEHRAEILSLLDSGYTTDQIVSAVNSALKNSALEPMNDEIVAIYIELLLNSDPADKNGSYPDEN